MVGAFALGTVFTAWQVANAEIEYFSGAILDSASVISPKVIEKHTKAPQQTVKSVYLTAYSANSPAKMAQIINLLDTTELNAVVIDIKDYTGYVLYDSQVSLVKKLGTKKVLIKDVPGLIKKLHEHNIYVIGRQTVFQDPILAQKKPDWAVLSSNGGLWRDFKGLSWVDATKKEVWQYNIAIAKEAVALGFDEMNFDYVRFPSDGSIKTMRFSDLKGSKHETMAEFYKTLGQELADEPAWLSLDLFGMTMEAKGENDMNIGQRIVDAVDNVDYIAPMMYPSHYPPGHLKFANPADHPGEIFEYGLKLGTPLFEGKRAKLRPWIQAFNLGATYGADKIRIQIDKIEKYTDAGFMMWNASNRYTAAGLKAE